MRLLCWVLSLAFGLLIWVPTAFAVDGTFRGKIADPPSNEPAVKGWIFVEGRNKMLRRVEGAQPENVYGAKRPPNERQKTNFICFRQRQGTTQSTPQQASSSTPPHTRAHP